MAATLTGPVHIAAAQAAQDGSIYSRYGLGELRTFSSSRIQAMGGGGTALWSGESVNLGNPATWSSQTLVHAAASMRFDGIRTQDAAENSKNLLSGTLGAIQFGMPLLTSRLGFGVAFEPYSRVNYGIVTDGSLVTDPRSAEDVAYRLIHTGTGGLQRVRTGLGYRPASWLSVGAAIEFLFGIIEETRRTTLFSDEFFETNLATSTRMRATTATAGASVLLADVLTENDALALAGTVTLPATVSANRAVTLGESLDRDTLGTRTEGSMHLPLGIRGGVSYALRNRWSATADLLYEPWTDFETDLSLPGIVPGEPGSMRDRRRISAGLEFLPAGPSQLESYFARIAYRLGFFVDEMYVSPAADSEVGTRAITGGLSFPAMLTGTRLDVTFQMGTRGSTARNLVRDRFLTLSLTVNIGERWFVKRKLG